MVEPGGMRRAALALLAVLALAATARAAAKPGAGDDMQEIYRLSGLEAQVGALDRVVAASLIPNLERVPEGDDLFTPAYGGFDVSEVTRRDPEPSAQGGLNVQLRTVSPDLEAIRVADRYAVIFSPYDLSCALERHESLECRGYVREDAARIAIHIVLYSLHH